MVSSESTHVFWDDTIGLVVSYLCLMGDDGIDNGDKVFIGVRREEGEGALYLLVLVFIRPWRWAKVAWKEEGSDKHSFLLLSALPCQCDAPQLL